EAVEQREDLKKRPPRAGVASAEAEWACQREWGARSQAGLPRRSGEEASGGEPRRREELRGRGTAFQAVVRGSAPRVPLQIRPEVFVPGPLSPSLAGAPRPGSAPAARAFGACP